jgi:hypothetical protein
VSWQVVPTALIEMLRDEDEAKSARVMRAMMRMGKIDIGELKRAYEAETFIVDDGPMPRRAQRYLSCYQKLLFNRPNLKEERR